jgi:hypothetical protein
MPRARKGPSGPKRSVAGKSGTNRATPSKGASTSKPSKSNMGGMGKGTWPGTMNCMPTREP